VAVTFLATGTAVAQQVVQNFHGDLVGAKQIEDLDLALGGGFEHRLDIEATFGGHKAEIETCHACRSRVQDIEAVPGQRRLERT